MKRSEILTRVKSYFSIEELVCPHIFKAHGVQAWDFFTIEYLSCLLVIRENILNTKMFCNSYSHGKTGLTERGIRCNICHIVMSKSLSSMVYMSAHVLAAGGDFSLLGMSAEFARKRIAAMSGLLPYPIRMEQDVNWLHFDTINPGTGTKIIYFSSK